MKNLRFFKMQAIWDYMGSTELIANLFRISQTAEKLCKDEVEDAKTALRRKLFLLAEGAEYTCDELAVKAGVTKRPVERACIFECVDTGWKLAF